MTFCSRANPAIIIDIVFLLSPTAVSLVSYGTPKVSLLIYEYMNIYENSYDIFIMKIIGRYSLIYNNRYCNVIIS